jgi:hypothetical protein
MESEHANQNEMLDEQSLDDETWLNPENTSYVHFQARRSQTKF